MDPIKWLALCLGIVGILDVLFIHACGVATARHDERAKQWTPSRTK